MVTPAGSECRFYYEDFNRGRNVQECRLILRNPDSAAWRPSDCSSCPVPTILAANNSPHCVLEAKISKGLLGLKRRVEVRAACSKHLRPIDNPIVGCSSCAAERPGLQQLFDDL